MRPLRPAWSSYSFPKQPAGFQPLIASNEDLAKYGLPPRPNAARKNEISYASWSRAMAAAKQAVPYLLNMVDQNGNPLADAIPQGPSADVFNVTGSAY